MSTSTPSGQPDPQPLAENETGLTPSQEQSPNAQVAGSPEEGSVDAPASDQPAEAPQVTAADVSDSAATLPRSGDDQVAQARQDLNAEQASAPAASDAPVQVVAQPIKVDGRNRRNGDDGLEGGFVRVVDGDHQGRVGVFLSVLQHATDGYPERILVRTRDEFDELLEVAYQDVAATSYHGGR